MKKKILIVCSTHFYHLVDAIKVKLEEKGYEVLLPNCYDAPVTSDQISEDNYADFFRDMYNESREKISTIDALLVLNYDKVKNNKLLKNYIGASTFLEIYEAYMQNKTIYLMNDIPDNILYDDIKGMSPIILNNDIEKVK